MRGRVLTAEDRVGRPRVALASQTAARAYWPNTDPIGQRVWLDTDEPVDPASTYEIVGVVGDVQYEAIDGTFTPQFYTSYLQFTWPYTFVMLKSRESPETMVPRLRRAVAEVDAELPIYDVRTLEDRVGIALSKSRFNALMLGGFASLALILAAVGMYGVMAHFVAQRTSEVGIRIALGARTSDVFRLVLRYGGTLALAGVSLGTVVSLAGTRILSSLVYDVNPADPRVLVVVNTVLTIVALLACYVPTRRALRVDPVRALQSN